MWMSAMCYVMMEILMVKMKEGFPYVLLFSCKSDILYVWRNTTKKYKVRNDGISEKLEVTE